MEICWEPLYFSWGLNLLKIIFLIQWFDELNVLPKRAFAQNSTNFVHLFFKVSSYREILPRKTGVPVLFGCTGVAIVLSSFLQRLVRHDSLSRSQEPLNTSFPL